MTQKLSAELRVNGLLELPNWQEVKGRDAIHRTFKFRNFREAFAFMTQAALMSEKLDHHPEWSNTYNSVEVVLTTHSANGLTELDIKLATYMDKIDDNSS